MEIDGWLLGLAETGEKPNGDPSDIADAVSTRQTMRIAADCLMRVRPLDTTVLTNAVPVLNTQTRAHRQPII